MIFHRIGITVCLAALLSFPLTVVADNHGQSGGSGGATASDGGHGDDHGQGQGNNNGDDHGGSTNNNNGSDDHGGENHGGTNSGPSNPGGADPRTPAGSGQNDNPGANNPTNSFQRMRVSLAATAAGSTIGAEGNADIRAQGNQQRLKVEVEANVPDGTMFNVMANNMPIGVITIHLGEGELEFESENAQALAGGLMPTAITSIAVTDSSNSTVLQAQFGPISTSVPPVPSPLLVRKEQQLPATSLGVTEGAEGNVDLRSQGADNRLKVEVGGKVADGTVWTVFANNGVKLGSVTFRLMEAELELETNDLLQASLSVPSSISSIQVNDAGGNLVLSATF